MEHRPGRGAVSQSPGIVPVETQCTREIIHRPLKIPQLAVCEAAFQEGRGSIRFQTHGLIEIVDRVAIAQASPLKAMPRPLHGAGSSRRKRMAFE